MTKDEPSHFKKSLENAEKIIGDQAKVKTLLDQFDRLLSKKNDSLHTVAEDLRRLRRMVAASQAGQYKKIPWKSILLAMATILYFVNPLDLIPDFLMGPGFLDDIGILLICLRRIHQDLEEFKTWEQENPPDPSKTT